MAQKENQRIALTKKLLQEGLLRLLENKSLDKISVTELCKESGINRATFYNHYCSPSDLLSSIEEKIINELTAIVNKHKPTNDVASMVEATCVYFYENKHTILALHNCHADAQITVFLYTINEEYQLFRLSTKFSQYLPSLRQGGLHLISTFFYSGCYNLILEWLKNDIQATPKEIAYLIIVLAKENFVD